MCPALAKLAVPVVRSILELCVPAQNEPRLSLMMSTVCSFIIASVNTLLHSLCRQLSKRCQDANLKAGEFQWITEPLCINRPMSTLGTHIRVTHVDHPVKDKQGFHPSVSFCHFSFFHVKHSSEHVFLCISLPFLEPRHLSEFQQCPPTASVSRALFVACLKNRFLLSIQGNKMQLLFTVIITVNVINFTSIM